MLQADREASGHSHRCLSCLRQSPTRTRIERSTSDNDGAFVIAATSFTRRIGSVADTEAGLDSVLALVGGDFGAGQPSMEDVDDMRV